VPWPQRALIKEFDQRGSLGLTAPAAAAFVGTHFLLSHPLRKPIVDTVGSAAFLGIYSAVAAATLGWLALAYRAGPAVTPLWPGRAERDQGLHPNLQAMRVLLYEHRLVLVVP
jgi:hypothetical protein